MIINKRKAKAVTGPFRLSCNYLRILSTLSVLALAGCGDGLPADRGLVTGRVTVDGEAVESGSITLYTPVDANSLDDAKTIADSNITDGNYSFESPIGSAKVVIRVPKVVGQRKAYNTPNSPLVSVTEESLPSKYNDKTELTLEVMSGNNEKDFELSTK